MSADDFEGVEDSSPVVRYSAKELFSQINRKLDVVLELAQSKASQVEVDALAGRVNKNESRIQTIEDRGSTHAIELANRVDVVESRVQTIEDRSMSNRDVLKTVAWAIATSITLAGLIIAYHKIGVHL